MAELTFIPEKTAVYEHRFLHMKEYVTKYHVRHNISTDTLLEVDSQIDSAFRDLVLPHLESASDTDLIGVQVIHESLQKPIFLSYVRRRDFMFASFTNRVYAVTQSNATFLLDGQFDVTVSVIKHITGGQPPIKSPRTQWNINRPLTVQMARHLSKSLVTVPSNGNDCGHIAVFLGQFRITSFFDLKLWKRYTDKRTRNRSLALAVRKFVSEVSKAQDCSIPLDIPVSLSVLQLYADYLGMQIVVFEANEDNPTNQSRLLFATTCNAPPDKQIFLELLHRKDSTTHYNLITRPAAYFHTKSFCFRCLTPYQYKHICPLSKCEGCDSERKCGNVRDKECDNCGHMCYSDSCLKQHQSLRTCQDRYMCATCRVSMHVKFRLSHKCLTYICKSCGLTYTESPHYCMIRPLKIQKDENLIITAFDIESMFVTDADGVETHVPILLVSLTVCNLCYCETAVLAKDIVSGIFKPLKRASCAVCLDYLHVYRGSNCVKLFCDYIYNTLALHASRIQKNMQVRVLAHNLKSYDGRFILRDFFGRNLSSSNIIMQGSKVLCLEVANVRFQDSLNLFMCPLRKLPSTFDFSDRVKKGDFPYKFNRPENQNYVGKVPSLEFFGYETLKPADQQALKEFHDSIKDKDDYDLQQEMERYCYADTEILLIAIMAFRKKFRAIAGFDPIRRYFTLPSMSMATYRSHFLKPDSLSVTPHYPYSSLRKSSTACRVYLDLLEEERSSVILREYRIGRVFADGFEPSTKTVIEFLGCVFHGCPSCFPDRTSLHPLTRKTPEGMYQKWQQKTAYYEHIKSCLIPELTIESEWECEFSRRMASNRPLRSRYERRLQYYRRLDQVGPCDLRESYCGGRTENFRFMKKCTSDEVIELVDFNSLYPAVLAKYPYPIGHPEVISGNFERYITETTISADLFGFVKCKVLPPRQMHIPLLPMRYNDRLEFVLCNRCGVENAKSYCNHSDEQRCLVGSFCTAELADAIKYGYKVREVFEILHWSSSSDELFRPYVFKWIKMKAEASGFPNWVSSDDDKERYVQTYFEETRAGGCPIRLDKCAIRKDEISRNIAKNLLNSFYGKFAEKQNKEQAVVISDYSSLWNLANDDDKIITGQITVDENKLLVNWRFKEETKAKRNGLVNIAVASFVTSYARRELWRAIHHLESANPGCVYYSDTDSIFYTCRRGVQAIPTGHNLGELVREVGADEEITTIIVLGPKNYAYVVRNIMSGNERIVIKVKGITLDAKTLKQINLTLLTKMCEAFVFRNETLEEHIQQQRIHASKDQIVTNRVIVKVYRAVSEKRVVVGNNTYPKGYMLS